MAQERELHDSQERKLRGSTLGHTVVRGKAIEAQGSTGCLIRPKEPGHTRRQDQNTGGRVNTSQREEGEKEE